MISFLAWLEQHLLLFQNKVWWENYGPPGELTPYNNYPPFPRLIAISMLFRGYLSWKFPLETLSEIDAVTSPRNMQHITLTGASHLHNISHQSPDARKFGRNGQVPFKLVLMRSDVS